MAKIIIINSCIECPNIEECKQWKKLTFNQRFEIKFGVIGEVGILKNCPLSDYKPD